MKKIIVLSVLLLSAIANTAVAQKPEITIKQMLQLDHFANPHRVLRKANVKEILYHEGNDSLVYMCFFGRNVDWGDIPFETMKITAPDAVGVFLSHTGSGGWFLLTDHTEFYDAYVKEAKKLGFSADRYEDVDGELRRIEGSAPLLQPSDDCSTQDITLYEYKRGVFTNRTLTIIRSQTELEVILGWEF